MNGLVDSADTRLCVMRRGEGLPLLLLVGLEQRADFWRGAIAHFAGRFDCISFDHRKTGDSLPTDIHSAVIVRIRLQ